MKIKIKAGGKYKRKGNFVRQVYRENQQRIEEAYKLQFPSNGTQYIGKPKTPYLWFKRQVLAHQKEVEVRGYKTMRMSYEAKDLSVSDIKARLGETLRSETFTSREERSKENLRKAFKTDKDAMHDLRVSLGWKKKVDLSNLEYHGDKIDKNNRYFYTRTEDGQIIAFRFGENYKNKKNIEFLQLDQFGNVERVL